MSKCFNAPLHDPSQKLPNLEVSSLSHLERLLSIRICSGQLIIQSSSPVAKLSSHDLVSCLDPDPVSP